MPEEYDLAYRYVRSLEQEPQEEQGAPVEGISSEVDGYEQVFDVSVNLQPVDLVPIRPGNGRPSHG